MNDFSRQMEMVLYNSEDGDVSVNAYIKDETLWVTQKTMAELFGVQVPAVSKHLKNIFADGELAAEVVISKMEITTRHGAIEGKTQTWETNFYNLDAVSYTHLDVYKRQGRFRLRRYSAGLHGHRTDGFGDGLLQCIQRGHRRSAV